MASESRLVLSVFRSVHQYSPLRRAISISRLARSVKTRSPNVKRLKTVKPRKKNSTHTLSLPLTHKHAHTHTQPGNRASEELYKKAFHSSAKTTLRQGSAEPPQ